MMLEMLMKIFGVEGAAQLATVSKQHIKRAALLAGLLAACMLQQKMM